MDDPRDLRARLAEQDREIEDLRRRVHVAEAERRAGAQQLTRYATDLNISFMNERRASEDLAESYRATVRALANAVEARDAYTGHHAERVTAYGLALADAIGLDATPETEFGFLLHDIGKVAVPDAILFKPASLTREERAVMKLHAVTGERILRDVTFLGTGRLIVRHHHERWDGGGYPDGLEGERIPPAARVFAVADALDALTTDRPYRSRSSFSAARDEIRAEAGTHFDPIVVAALDEMDDDELLAGQELPV